MAAGASLCGPQLCAHTGLQPVASCPCKVAARTGDSRRGRSHSGLPRAEGRGAAGPPCLLRGLGRGLTPPELQPGPVARRQEEERLPEDGAEAADLDTLAGGGGEGRAAGSSEKGPGRGGPLAAGTTPARPRGPHRASGPTDATPAPRGHSDSEGSRPGAAALPRLRGPGSACPWDALLVPARARCPHPQEGARRPPRPAGRAWAR